MRFTSPLLRTAGLQPNGATGIVERDDRVLSTYWRILMESPNQTNPPVKAVLMYRGRLGIKTITNEITKKLAETNEKIMEKARSLRGEQRNKVMGSRYSIVAVQAWVDSVDGLVTVNRVTGLWDKSKNVVELRAKTVQPEQPSLNIPD